MQSALSVTETPIEAPPQRLVDEHRALMARIAVDRDRHAFEALFTYYGPRLKAMLLKSGADHALAEDLVQDVMMTVWRKVELYAPDRGTVSSWIYTIARNARIDRLRRNSSQPYEDVETLELASADKGAEEETFANQQATHIAEALAGLPHEQRQVIELAFVHDISQSGIAEQLALPLGTVKSRMRLAYAKLKTGLEEIR